MKSGEVIGERFEVQNLVGAGGMGQVFRARDLRSGGTVAVKTLLTQNEEARERFAREARLLARLRHPGLVRYVTHGSHETIPYLVMEWLTGQDLSAALGGQGYAPGGFPLDDVLALGRRVAGALAELHQHGIVHRDIKLSNVFLVQGSLHQAKVLDLGVAQTDQSGVKLTGVCELVGSPMLHVTRTSAGAGSGWTRHRRVSLVCSTRPSRASPHFKRAILCWERSPPGWAGIVSSTCYSTLFKSAVRSPRRECFW